MRILDSLLILALMLNPVSALILSIQPSQTSVNINENLSINYEIGFTTPSIINYSILMRSPRNNITVITVNNVSVSSLVNQIGFNVTKELAGEYSLFLEVSGYSPEPSIQNVTINPTTNVSNTEFDVIYVVGNETSEPIIVSNNGNTEVAVTAYVRGVERSRLMPYNYFTLSPSEEQELFINLPRPEATARGTVVLIFENSYATDERLINFTAMLPSINISLNNVTVIPDANESTVILNLGNQGNLDQNVTVGLRLYDFSTGYETIQSVVPVPAGTSNDFAFEVPKKQVVSVSVTYFNSSGQSMTEKRILSPIDYIPWDLKLNADKNLLIVLGVLVLGLVFYFKFLKRKRRHD